MYVIRMVREVVPSMKARGGGSILNITAISAIQPIAGFSLSVATWSGVIGYAKTLSLEVAPFGINVNTICPGLHRHDAAAEGVRGGQRSRADVVKARLTDEIPMKRIGTIEDIANLVALLVSPKGRLHHRDRDPGGRRIAAGGPVRRSTYGGHHDRDTTAAEPFGHRTIPEQGLVEGPDASRKSWNGARAKHPLARRSATPADASRTGDLWREVKRFAEFLRRQGVQRGDVVTLQLPNRIEFPVVFFSLELIGAVANKISADFRALEVEYILKFSRSKAYVCASQFKGFDYLAMIRELRPRLPDLSLVDLRRRRRMPTTSTSFAKVVHETPEIADADRVHMSPLDVMRMCFTSGTTGNPKGVLHCFNTTLCTCETFNTRARGDRERRDARLPAGRAQLGIHDARPVGDGRRPRGPDGALLRRRRARADRKGARHLHPDGTGVDRRDAEFPGADASTISARCGS